MTISALIALDGGANPVCEIPSNCQISTLVLAILSERLELADAMLAKGVKIDDVAYKIKGQMILMLAVRNAGGHAHLILWLLEKGASVTTRSLKGLTALDYATKRPGIDRSILIELVKRGAVIEYPNKDTKPPLAQGLEGGRWATATELIGLGASLARTLEWFEANDKSKFESLRKSSEIKALQQI